jgi:hypothetical protein
LTVANFVRVVCRRLGLRAGRAFHCNLGVSFPVFPCLFSFPTSSLYTMARPCAMLPPLSLARMTQVQTSPVCVCVLCVCWVREDPENKGRKYPPKKKDETKEERKLRRSLKKLARKNETPEEREVRKAAKTAKKMRKSQAHISQMSSV